MLSAARMENGLHNRAGEYAENSADARRGRGWMRPASKACFQAGIPQVTSTRPSIFLTSSGATRNGIVSRFTALAMA